MEHKEKTIEFFEGALELLDHKNLNKNEECILNIVACFTNFLYYDIPEQGKEDQAIFDDQKRANQVRAKCINKIGKFIFMSDNEEL